MVSSGHCVTVLGLTPGCCGDHWVSSSLEGAMHVPLHVLVVLLCSEHRVFSSRLPFLDSPFFLLSYSLSIQ